MRNRPVVRLLLSMAFCVLVPVPAFADHAAFPVEHGFLSVPYKDMRVIERPGGFDLAHIAPGAFERLAEYDGIIINQPEIWIDPKSSYPGGQPDYLKAIVDLVRDTLIGRLLRGGHHIVEVPGPNVLFMRIAVTDLYLKKKQGKIIVPQPIGSTGNEEILRTLIENVDIIELALQMELVDSVTEELLGAVVIRRGELKKGKKGADGRLDFTEFWEIVEEYADRVRCRFDNAKRPKDEWKDCVVDDS